MEPIRYSISLIVSVILFLPLVLTGCEDSPLFPDNLERGGVIDEIHPSVTNVVNRDGERLVRPSEIPFIELSEQISEFAGFWIDDGNLVIHLTNESNADQHRQIVVNYVNEIKEHMEFDAAKAITKKVTYNFSELRNWRD